MKHLLLVLLLSLAAFSQQPTTQVAILGPAPSGITSGSASPVGAGGGQTIFYYVIARYPSGIAYPGFSIQARNTAGIGNLSSQNSVVISWSGMSGATGYDVIRQATQTSPNNPCTGCAVVLNTTSTTATDTGANGGNYPPALPSVGDQTAILQVDNISRSYPFPTTTIASQRLQNALIASFTAGSPAAFDSQGRLVNGAAPTGGTVTSVSAAAPLAASPNPIVGAGTISADTTVLGQKFFGTAAPGSVAGNLPGDLFTDTTNHVEYYCGKAAGTTAPACTAVGVGNWTTSSSGAGTVTSVTCGAGLTGGTITASGTCAVDTTLISQKFFGTAPPGSVSGNLPGDTFSDTTNHIDYWCNAVAGTPAPACTSVTTGGWTQTGNTGTVTSITATAPLTGGVITASGSIGADTTVLGQKFFGTAAPGSVAGNLPGDLFTDTTNHVEYYCGKAAGTTAPACTAVGTGNWTTSTAGAGTVTSVTCGTGMTGGTITASGTCAVDTTLIGQKFFGTAAPGSVAGNLPGDTFSDTTNHNDYWCNAVAGTPAPACTSVTTGGWTLLNQAGGTTVTTVPPYLTVGGTVVGPVFPFTAPTLAGWTVANSAVFSTSNGYLYLTGAIAGTAVRGIFATAPAAPYTRTYFVDPDISGASSASTGVGNEVGWVAGWRQSSTGKIVTFLVGTSGGAPAAAFDYWTTATSFSAQHDVRNGAAMSAMATRGKYFVRLADDNTNITVSTSTNGLDFLQIFQAPRGDFTIGGPDQIFLGVYPGSAPATLAVYSIANP